MDYYSVKHVHVALAALSGVFFFIRGLWMLRGSQLAARPWARVLPHVIDSLLLLAALVLVVWSAQYPIQQGWLTAKLIALLLYIGLGTVALKRGRTRTIRAIAYCAALATFAYIAAVAVTKNPLVFG